MVELILMLCLFRFNTEEEALAISNSSLLGLAGLSILSKLHLEFYSPYIFLPFISLGGFMSVPAITNQQVLSQATFTLRT